MIIAEFLRSKGFECRRIDDECLTDYFETSDDDMLGAWLRNKGRVADSEGLATVWVLTGVDMTEVLGYFTLSAHTILKRDVNRPDRFYDPRNGAMVGAYERVPAVLLGKFALDLSLIHI